MLNSIDNIYPDFKELKSKFEWEERLNQRAKAIWLTGLSGSGKSTLAKGLENKLFQLGYIAKVLDGDNVRIGLSNNLLFTEGDRLENIRRVAEASKLFLELGIITINSFISPTNKVRNMACEIIGTNNFIEVFINAPVEVCEKRDVKGLYKKARNGEIENFTGITSPFEAPNAPNLILNTSELTIDQSINTLIDYILPHIKLSQNTKK